MPCSHQSPSPTAPVYQCANGTRVCTICGEKIDAHGQTLEDRVRRLEYRYPEAVLSPMRIESISPKVEEALGQRVTALEKRLRNVANALKGV